MNTSDLVMIGLSEREAVIYDLLLSTGRMAATELSRKANMPRTTVYMITESLQEKKLIGTISESGGVKFYAEPPERLLALCTDQYHKELHRLERARLAVGEAQRNYHDPVFLSIVVSDGDELMYQYDQCIGGNPGTVRCLGDVEKLVDFCGKPLVRNHFLGRVTTKTETKIITTHSKAAIDFSKVNYLGLRETILIHTTHDFSGDFCIWSDRISFFDYETRRLVVVTNPDMARIIAALFDYAWERTQMIGLHFVLPPDSDKRVYPVIK